MWRDDAMVLFHKATSIQIAGIGGSSTVLSAMFASPTAGVTYLTGSLTAVLLVLKIVEKVRQMFCKRDNKHV